MLKTTQIICIILVSVCFKVECSNKTLAANKKAKIQYYETIIENNVEETNSWKQPTKNSEFEEGIKSNKIVDYGTFDYVIIGAGSAGSVIASRLSEISSISVLVIEAGGEESDFSQIPGYNGYLQKLRFNWGYLTTPQTSCCLGMNDNRCAAPRGKSVGGSNVINGMIYLRGNPLDYQKWANEYSPLWSWSHVFPYFLKSENVQARSDPGYHASGGLWNVQHNQPEAPLAARFLQANVQAGTPFVADSNGATQLGCYRFQFTERHGQRLTSARAFLGEARARPNLNMTTHSYATRVEIADGSAKSVLFARGGRKYRANAKREVILSAGAYNSPQLLMLSGIGPKAELTKHGIEMVRELPVGQTLKEQPFFIGIRFVTNRTEETVSLSDQLSQFLEGNGPLTIPTFLENFAFLPFENDSTVAFTEVVHQPIVNSGIAMNYAASNIKSDIIDKYVQNTTYQQFSISPVLLHQLSNGSVTLKSKDPVDFPLIDYNFFTDKEGLDLKRFIKAIKYILDLQKTPAYRAINATFIPPPVCTDKKMYSDDYWKCVLRHLTSVIYHPTGTCAMGKEGVVDDYLKVHGIKGLRVVDTSILPITLTGHPNAPIVMVAERAADFIKEENGFSVGVCSTVNDGELIK